MLYNDFPGVRELEALAAVQGPTCVSIVTPTEDKPQHPDAAVIGLRNQAKAALDQVADRFHLKPLLRATTFPQSAFVLALAENSVRLLALSGDEPAAEVDVPDLPVSAADYAGKASITGRSDIGGMSGGDQRSTRVLQYVRAVDRALRAVLPDGQVPLILAAAEPIAATYREVSSYPGLIAETVAGSPETRSAAQLAESARPVLDRYYAAQIADWHRVFDERRNQGRALTDVADVARAATYGQVASVLVDMDTVVPGSVDPDTGAVSLAESAGSGYGVVDEIARRALLTGARVLAVRREDIPDGAELAAVLRFAP